MTRLHRGRIAGVLLVMAGLLLWGRAVWLSSVLAGFSGGYRLLYQEEQTLEPDPFGEDKTDWHYGAAGQRLNQTIRGEQFGRETNLLVLETAGDAALLLPAHPLLSGGFPLDGLGCAVDQDTAYALWGDLDVTGKTVLYEYEEYRVTGVFQSSQPMMVLRPATGITFRHAVFSPPAGDVFPRRSLDQFLLDEGLSTPDVAEELSIRRNGLRQLSLLPVLLPAGLLLAHLLREALPDRKKLRGCGVAAGILLLSWGMGVRPQIPLDYLPTRWSDFSFWPTLARRLQTEEAIRWMQPSLMPDYLLNIQYQRPILWCSVLAVAAFLLGFRLLRPQPPFHD